MQKLFKYDVEQLIYYMGNNKVHSAPVLGRLYVEECVQQIGGSLSDLPNGCHYKTCHGIFTESEVFGTRQELLESL
jgi:hypothetical protein